jgi:hypothetical protein
MGPAPAISPGIVRGISVPYPQSHWTQAGQTLVDRPTTYAALISFNQVATSRTFGSWGVHTGDAEKGC